MFLSEVPRQEKESIMVDGPRTKRIKLDRDAETITVKKVSSSLPINIYPVVYSSLFITCNYLVFLLVTLLVTVTYL